LWGLWQGLEPSLLDKEVQKHANCHFESLGSIFEASKHTTANPIAPTSYHSFKIEFFFFFSFSVTIPCSHLPSCLFEQVHCLNKMGEPEESNLAAVITIF
jgi:hypothetical protein